MSAWRRDPATLAVMAALGGDRDEARFVGGCVRNTVLGRAISDIDIATIHRPDESMRRLEAAGLTVKSTGIAHGTVTAIADHRPFEITTLRRDVETDGRHATVAFSDDWAEDARRRDFTMNALFMDIDGRIFDPVGGIEDARAGRVRFVGEAGQRIAEDVLRVLRFFRFQAHYGRSEPDAEARRACRDAAPLMANLSGERVRAELLKLLMGEGAGAAIRVMVEDAILSPFLTRPPRLEAVLRLIALEGVCEEGGEGPGGLRRLATLSGDPPAPLAARLRLSGGEAARLAAMAEDRVDPGAAPQVLRAALYRLGKPRFIDAVMVSHALNAPEDAPEDVPRPVATALDLAQRWQVPAMPVRGADLRHLGLAEGDGIGQLLREIEARWIASDFTADRAQCLSWARAAIEDEG